MGSHQSADRPTGTLTWTLVRVVGFSAMFAIIWLLWPRRTPEPLPVAASGVAQASADTSGGPSYAKGRLGKPLGTVVTIRGVVFENRLKAEAGSPSLDVRMIDGVAVDRELHVLLAPYFLEWGETYDSGKGPPTLRVGDWFELEGYETGGYIGIPEDAYKRAGAVLETADFGFRHEFRVFDGRAIDPLPSTSAE